MQALLIRNHHLRNTERKDNNVYIPDIMERKAQNSLLKRVKSALRE
jgi:hypothetical protein